MDCFPLCWVCANGGFRSAPSRAAGSVKSFLTHRSLWKPSQETREPMQPTPPDSLFASGDTQRSRSAHPTSWFPEHGRRRGWGAGHLWRAHQWGVSRVAMRNWMSCIHPPGAASGVKGGSEHERNMSCSFVQAVEGPGSSPSQPPQNRAPDRKMKPTQEGLLFWAPSISYKRVWMIYPHPHICVLNYNTPTPVSSLCTSA